MEKHFDPLFIKCDCGSDLFEIRKVDDDPINGFEISFWKLGRINHPLSWKERFRWCRRILRTGDPWADGVVVTNEKAKLISKYIEKNI